MSPSPTKRAFAAAFVLSLFTVGASSARAQTVDLQMTADRTQLAVGETFQLRVEARMVNVDAAQVQLPDLSAFDVITRRFSRPMTLRVGGLGGATQTESREVHDLTLRARAPGRVRVAPARVVAGGRTYTSSPLDLQVSGSASSGAPNAAPGIPGQPGQPSQPAQVVAGQAADGMVFDNEAFLRAYADVREPVVGQQVTVTLYLYTAARLSGQPNITQEMTTDGFWKHDLLPPTRRLDDRNTAQMGGRRFFVYVLRRFALFPQRAGRLTIGAARLEVTQNGLFQIFGRRAGPSTWVRQGVPLEIDVQELPASGRPTGDVFIGHAAVSATLDRDEVPTGDAVTVALQVRVRGPVAQVPTPTLAGAGLRVLAPEVHDEETQPNDLVGGVRTIRWLVIPEAPGAHPIGPFEVPYFDPNTGRYEVARSAPLTLTAVGNAIAAAEDEPAERLTPEAEETARFGPIRTRSALSRAHASTVDAPWFLALFAAGPLIFLAALALRVGRARAGKIDAAGAPKRARRAAKRRLAAAAKHAAAAEPREFYGAVSSALKEVLEAKLGRPVGSLTHRELREVLRARGMNDAVADRLIEELEGSDFARFSTAGAETGEMERCLERARALVSDLDGYTANPPADAA